MAFKVIKKLDAAVWLSQSDTLPFELWHQVASFLVEPKLDNYLIIDDVVLFSEPGKSSMTPLRIFKKKKLIPLMHRKTFGTKRQNSEISLQIVYGCITIKQALAL